jgi:hypothetical protein
MSFDGCGRPKASLRRAGHGRQDCCLRDRVGTDWQAAPAFDRPKFYYRLEPETSFVDCCGRPRPPSQRPGHGVRCSSTPPRWSRVAGRPASDRPESYRLGMKLDLWSSLIVVGCLTRPRWHKHTEGRSRSCYRSVFCQTARTLDGQDPVKFACSRDAWTVAKGRRRDLGGPVSATRHVTR